MIIVLVLLYGVVWTDWPRIRPHMAAHIIQFIDVNWQCICLPDHSLFSVHRAKYSLVSTPVFWIPLVDTNSKY